MLQPTVIAAEIASAAIHIRFIAHTSSTGLTAANAPTSTVRSWAKPGKLSRMRRAAGLAAAIFCVGSCLSVVVSLVAAPSAAVGVFESAADVGSPKIAGTAAYNPISQDYALSAAGTNMWAQRDEFQFVSEALNGDFILQTRVAFAGAGVDPHRKAGLVIRSGTDADAPYVDAVVHGDGLTSLQFRRTKGAVTEEKRSTITGADVLQLERRGTRFVMSAAKFGDPYTVTELTDMTLPGEVLAGLALCAHNPDVVERAVFSNVRDHPAGGRELPPVSRLHR